MNQPSSLSTIVVDVRIWASFGRRVSRRASHPDAAVASGKSLTPGVVVGRESELARLRRLLDEAAAGRCGALLVEGEPGVGKTTLLEAARALAGGFTCLRALGAESESQLAHAGLLELLNPVRDLLSEVPEAQAAALRSALGWSPDPATADPFLVGAAHTLVARGRGRASSRAGRRRRPAVAGSRVLGSHPVRRPATGTRCRRVRPGRPHRRCSGRPHPGRPARPSRSEACPPAAAAALLPSGLTRPALERLVAGTDGNPLAMLEVSQRLDAAQRLGAAPMPDPLPTGDRLSMLYRATLAGLSPAARAAALLVALVGAAETGPAAFTKALIGRGVDPGSALDEVLEHGVLVREGGRYRFRHPLLRGAVLDLATPAELREGHAALADALPVGDRAAVWHRAESTLGRRPAGRRGAGASRGRHPRAPGLRGGVRGTRTRLRPHSRPGPGRAAAGHRRPRRLPGGRCRAGPRSGRPSAHRQRAGSGSR